MPGRLLVRADAYPLIGVGHVMRCLALGQYWQDMGGSASLIACRLADGIRDRLEAEGIETIVTDAEIGSAADLEATVEAARSRQVRWVVLDGYRFRVEHQRMLRQAGLGVLAIDDNAEMEQFECELVVNQNIHASPELYAGRCSPETELLLGTRYVLLRREFRRLGDKREARRIPEQVDRILVTLGGGDPDNVTGRVMRALASLGASELAVDVIAGGANPHYDQLAELAQSLPGRFDLVRNATDMPQRIARADLAVTAGGSTCWEMAYLGLPNVVVVLADNQRACAAALDAQGCSVNLGWHEDCDEARIAEASADLVGDPKRRAEMSHAGMGLVDGEGVERVTRRVTMEP